MGNTYDRRLEGALDALREAAPASLTFSRLKALGIDNPAQVIYELELAGYAIDRRNGGVRLISSDAPPERARPPR